MLSAEGNRKDVKGGKGNKSHSSFLIHTRRVVILISTFPRLGHFDKDEGSRYLFFSLNFILLKSVNSSILLFSAKDKISAFHVSVTCTLCIERFITLFLQYVYRCGGGT